MGNTLPYGGGSSEELAGPPGPQGAKKRSGTKRPSQASDGNFDSQKVTESWPWLTKIDDSTCNNKESTPSFTRKTT